MLMLHIGKKDDNMLKIGEKGIIRRNFSSRQYSVLEGLEAEVVHVDGIVIHAMPTNPAMAQYVLYNLREEGGVAMYTTELELHEEGD